MASLEDIMAELHSGLAKDLLKRVQSGEATASELNVVRQFLKDNNIDAIPAAGSPLAALTEALPFNTEDVEGYH